MAEPLKNSFSNDVPQRIAADIIAHQPDFDTEAFLAQCLDGFEDLELLDRGRRIATALADHLPADRGEALDILVRSMGAELIATSGNGMGSFYYLPHTFFIASEGLDHFEAAMRANYEVTKRFTAEASIRPYLEHHTEATLRRLRTWAEDPNVHVRRLVSEGTRPRLPWAGRLRIFQEDPSPVLELLEVLNDDADEYVRRSVANNLNDISKDHPDTVIEVARRWWAEGDSNRRRLVRHGLRTLIKRGNPEALAILGFGPDSPVEVIATSIQPPEPAIGERVRLSVEVGNPSTVGGAGLLDFRIHFVKSNGSTSPKVFKGGEVDLGPGETGVIATSVSLKQHSTRTHYPGRHSVEVLLNGVAFDAGSFTLTPAP